ncbi:alpha/beta hydrolase [uncultured Sphingorhabdus sp.]|uniref:alpha/beta fold hydrolase n=1 Tax=uncultured Sphingorhabdus sp. TaxID=1686106 RepID=UPI00260DC11F|nr:alpha/beta hydrolase [uncultured Sphingorhabdus sp.]HMS20864.1 alpha/beta hydrolase [Sphingorhabdus sp.]
MLKSSLRRVYLSTDVELDCCVIGEPSNPAIIFLHGFPESHRTWRHQLLALSENYYCIAPDQRGYRGSSKPIDVSAYTADKLTADVFALADSLDVDEFTIAGHDWGGAIAWSVALNGQPGGLNAQWAGRVTRAMIANAPHPAVYQRLLVSDPVQREAAQYVRFFRDPAADAIVDGGGLLPLLEKVWGWQKPEAMDAYEYGELLAGWEDRAAATAMLNWYRASIISVPAIGEVIEVPEWAAAGVPKLTIPTLLVWAMEDKALSPSNIEGIDELVPDVHIERIADCGHFVTWEKPEAVIAAMQNFLAHTN